MMHNTVWIGNLVSSIILFTESRYLIFKPTKFGLYIFICIPQTAYGGGDIDFDYHLLLLLLLLIAL